MLVVKLMGCQYGVQSTWSSRTANTTASGTQPPDATDPSEAWAHLTLGLTGCLEYVSMDSGLCHVTKCSLYRVHSVPLPGLGSWVPVGRGLGAEIAGVAAGREGLARWLAVFRAQ